MENHHSDSKQLMMPKDQRSFEGSINNEQIITALKMCSTPLKNLCISLAVFICTSILPLYVKYVQKFETEDKPFES